MEINKDEKKVTIRHSDVTQAALEDQELSAGDPTVQKSQAPAQILYSSSRTEL